MRDEGQDAADDVDRIRLALPALPPYGRVARLAVTGLASRNGFTYLDVEDLRIAAGELFGVLIEPTGADGRVAFSCSLRPDAFELVAERDPARPIAEVTALTRLILEGVVDEVDIDQAGGRIRILKRLRP